MRNRKVFTVIIFCFIFVTLALTQQPGEISYHDESVMPEGKKGERIRSLIDTFNSHDPERIRRFIEDTFSERFRKSVPMSGHIDVFLREYRLSGSLEFHSIRTYMPERKNETVVILKAYNFDNWRSFLIKFDKMNDYLISSLQFHPARTPTNVDEPPLSEEQFLQEVKTIINRVCQGDVFSGTVLIVKGDRVLLSHACGEASKRFHAPNKIDTKFNLGSMNKMFTATAVAQLVEKGVLSYQDPISKYVDKSWLPEEMTFKIQIHHLLSHTSGLGSYFNETFAEGSRAQWRDVDDYKPLVRGEKLAFEPGARFRYSNTGMLLLGVVIESATGENYFDYIRKNIYEPAGMKNSDSYEMDDPVENLAIGYYSDRKSPYGWKNNYFQHVIKGGPAGGGFSTVEDLYKFARALLAEKLVSRKSLDILWKDHTGENYGYGFRTEEGPNGQKVGHGGGFPGINANLDIFVDKGYIVAVLSNYDRAASPLARKIDKLLTRVE
jgi:CubicO group peptidase (beta-lactamase class C family)